jgi:hypothetical protein
MRALILVTLLFACALSFQIAKVEDVQEVNWPFKSCGDGDFTVSKFTWAQTPTAGKKLTFTIVLFLLFRAEQLKMLSMLLKPASPYLLMDFQSM